MSQVVDHEGNYDFQSHDTAQYFGGHRAPGDLLNTINTGVSGQHDICHDGTYLYVVSDAIYQIDEGTGAVMSTIAIGSTSDFGLGLDTSRNYFVTTNAGSDVITQYDMTGLTVNQWSYPSTGYVGLAWDSLRDVYWVCDWSTNLLSAVDPTTGVIGTSWDMGSYGATRSAGVGYDAINDELLVGSRDTNLIYAIDPASGTVLRQFMSIAGGGNDPSGITSTPRQTCWHSSYYNTDLYELDTGYGSGPSIPKVDIKCNGGDVGVQVLAGTNCKVDYSVKAGIGAGVPVDIWVAFKHPFGFFTYDGVGPYMGWNMGLGNALYTGALADMNGTCLDFALGINSYKAYIGIDTKANGVLNMGNLYAMDVVDFDVVAPPKIYAWDDGTTENLLAWTSGGDMCWLDGWTAYAGGETLLDMHCMFGSAMYPGYAPGNGTNCNGYIWDDPTNDSDPSDCTLLATEALVVAQVDTDLYNIFPLTAPTVVSGVFFVGCVMPHGVGEYCLPMDQTGPYTPGTCWYCGTTTMGGFDPNNLMNNQYTPAEYGVNFCIRAGY